MLKNLDISLPVPFIIESIESLLSYLIDSTVGDHNYVAYGDSRQTLRAYLIILKNCNDTEWYLNAQDLVVLDITQEKIDAYRSRNVKTS